MKKETLRGGENSFYDGVCNFSRKIGIGLCALVVIGGFQISRPFVASGESVLMDIAAAYLNRKDGVVEINRVNPHDECGWNDEGYFVRNGEVIYPHNFDRGSYLEKNSGSEKKDEVVGGNLVGHD
jgi:hypothetical protein